MRRIAAFLFILFLLSACHYRAADYAADAADYMRQLRYIIGFRKKIVDLLPQVQYCHKDKGYGDISAAYARYGRQE